MRERRKMFEECQRWIEACFGAELESSLQGEFEAHVSDCPHCGFEASSWKECFEWLQKTFPDQQAAEDMWERIFTGIEGWGKSEGA